MAGVVTGLAQYQQSRENAKAAEANAARAVEMQAYEQQVKENNLALVNADSKEKQDQQDQINAVNVGSVVASMGATGVQITGTFMDLLGQEAILGANKTALIKSHGLRLEAGARTAGDVAVWQQQVAESQYRFQAKQHKSAATWALIGAGVSAATGMPSGGTPSGGTAMSQGGASTISSPWYASTASPPPPQPMGF
jgi:hypothetical protein